MSTAQASQILEAVTRAADAAAQAAQAKRESNDQARAQKGGFSEASKVVKCPTSFGSANSAEDQSNWLDFAFSSSNGWFTLNLDLKQTSNMLRITSMFLCHTLQVLKVLHLKHVQRSCMRSCQVFCNNDH